MIAMEEIVKVVYKHSSFSLLNPRLHWIVSFCRRRVQTFDCAVANSGPCPPADQNNAFSFESLDHDTVLVLLSLNASSPQHESPQIIAS